MPFWSGRARLQRTFRFPDFVRIDLRLAEACEIVSDGLFGVQSEMLGVGADESLVEDAAGKNVEMFFFDGLKHARADLSDVRNLVEREFFLLARLAEFVAEFAHIALPEGTSFARMMTGTS